MWSNLGYAPSAMRFVCVIHIPGEMLLFSLAGCLGMMGYHSSGCMVGVNNLNSTDARSGVLWPALVRSTLNQINQMPCASIYVRQKSYISAQLFSSR